MHTFLDILKRSVATLTLCVWKRRSTLGIQASQGGMAGENSRVYLWATRECSV